MNSSYVNGRPLYLHKYVTLLISSLVCSVRVAVALLFIFWLMTDTKKMLSDPENSIKSGSSNTAAIIVVVMA